MTNTLSIQTIKSAYAAADGGYLELILPGVSVVGLPAFSDDGQTIRFAEAILRDVTGTGSAKHRNGLVVAVSHVLAYVTGAEGSAFDPPAMKGHTW